MIFFAGTGPFIRQNQFTYMDVEVEMKFWRLHKESKIKLLINLCNKKEDIQRYSKYLDEGSKSI